MNRVAVIGAGLCGATAAAKLLQSGYQVSVFDKGRAVGGRMSSKRTEAGYLDMGAQYFTARSETFQRQVQSWLDAGCVEVWDCNTASLTQDDGPPALDSSPDQQLRYIGTPSMQAPVTMSVSMSTKPPSGFSASSGMVNRTPPANSCGEIRRLPLSKNT